MCRSGHCRSVSQSPAGFGIDSSVRPLVQVAKRALPAYDLGRGHWNDRENGTLQRVTSVILAAAGLLAWPVEAATSGADAADAAAQAYVQGRLAVAGDDFDTAARRFGDALKTGPDAGLQRRALDVAILSGDMKAAARLANEIPIGRQVAADAGGGSTADSLIALIRAANAASLRDWRAYDAARAAFGEPATAAQSNAILSTGLQAYGLAARGDVEKALALVEPGAATGIARSYLTEMRGHLLVLARRWPEAADLFGAMIAAEGANVSRLRMAAVAAALEAGRTDPAYRTKAITWLGSGPERDAQLEQARRRLQANPRLDGTGLGGLIERPADGLALMFLRVAADLSRERASGPALGFARLSTVLAPDMPETWLATADTLARGDKPALAMEALARVPDLPPWDELALARRAALLMGEARYDEARALLKAPTQAAGAGIDEWARLAEAERRAGDNRAAAVAYDRAIALLPAEVQPQHAQLFFLRGSAHELSGNFAQAEADLRRAVELAPNSPIYLNYLGYSLLDRRLMLAEARGFIARAYKLAPENGAIIDSMGWAEYVTGNYAEAVRLLEMARAAEPADPTVADHLGDALWQAGRRFEARHAWASAAALEPEAKLAAVLARKIDFGLDVALAAR